MRSYLIVLSAAAGLIWSGATAAQAAPVQAAAGLPPPPGVVSATPASNTPHLKATNDNPTQQVRQLVQCGNTMFAVGNFNLILKGSTSYTRTDVFSFQATAPFTVTAWAPQVTGSVINSITFSGGNCGSAYVGGSFSSINGTAVQNIAKIDTTTGNVVSGFAHNASGQVESLLGVAGHILAGGYYTSINGTSADPYMTSLNPATGTDDGFVHLNISGNYQFPGVSPNPTRVYNQELSHGGTLDLVMGDFTSVGGLGRQQIFMLNLATSPATVTGWTSYQWDGTNPNYPYQCATVEPFYIKAASWSPDDGTVYIGTTGFHPWNFPTGNYPRTGLCDAAAAFPATQTSVTSRWVNYTGCDSLYATAADANAAYFGGHQRWFTNPSGCDSQGPGAIPAPGLAGLSPASGALFVNAAGTAGYYSRDRGLGADDMLLTSAGLWTASDNFQGSQNCGGVTNLSGICFLPYGP